MRNISGDDLSQMGFGEKVALQNLGRSFHRHLLVVIAFIIIIIIITIIINHYNHPSPNSHEPVDAQ